MRIRLTPSIVFVSVALLVGAVVFGIYSYRHRFVRSDMDMLGLLPDGGRTTFFANVALLRRAGMLTLLAGSKAGAEPEYRNFIRDTRFDYTKDLDAIAAAADDSGLLIVLRGRFEWGSLRQYASAHGGTCRSEICRVPASKPGRWLSFRAIQPDVMALALSPDPMAVNTLHPAARQVAGNLPASPIWLHVAPRLLKSPLGLPVPLRIFAISLQPADSVWLSMGPPGRDSEAAFELKLDAYCPSQATAETIRNQMEIQTRMLKLELTREHKAPNPADLTGLLTSGSFRVVNKRLEATWPVRKQLLDTLE